MQNLVVVSHTLGAHVEGPKTFVDAGASPLWDGAMVLDEIGSSPRYYAKFLRSRSTTWVQVGGPKNGGW